MKLVHKKAACISLQVIQGHPLTSDNNAVKKVLQLFNIIGVHGLNGQF